MPPKVKQTKSTIKYQTMTLPFHSDPLKRAVNCIVKQSHLPIRAVYQSGANIKKNLVRSAYNPLNCSVRERFIERKSQKVKSRGRPRDDCITCQCGFNPGIYSKKNVVYSIDCCLCGEQYIGETKRQVRSRLSEHHFQARNKSDGTAWGEHMRMKYPQVVLDKEPVFVNGSVLATAEQAPTRKYQEAVEIRDKQLAVNRCSS